MFGKMAKFIEKYGMAICCAITALLAVVVLCLSLKDWPAEQQVKTLYEKAEHFTGNINTFSEIPGVSVSENNNEIRITYEEEDCKLIDVYDTNGKLLTRKFVTKHQFLILASMYLILALIGIVSYYLGFALARVLEHLQARLDNKKRLKQQKQEASKDSNKHNKK